MKCPRARNLRQSRLRSTISREPGSARCREAGRPHPRSSRASRRRIPALRTQCPRPMCPGRRGRRPGHRRAAPSPRMSLPARGNRFRRLRNRPARLLSATMPARHRPPAPRPQGRPFAVRRLRDQFVSGYVRASAHRPGCNYSAPFRGHASRIIRRLTVFAAISTRERWAVTGRFREKF